MTDDQLRQLAADVINGKTDPATIPSGWEFLRIQKAIQRMNRPAVTKRMLEVSRSRLTSKGFVELEGMGWKTRDEIKSLDLVKKDGRWFVGDPRRHLATAAKEEPKKK